MGSRIAQIVMLGLVVVLVSSCACKRPVKIQPIQRKDKLLSCKEITLEINEAEFYRRAAEETLSSTADNLFSPMCYVSVTSAAEEAMNSADERLEYLNQLYDLMGCNRSRTTRPAPVPPTGYRN